MTLLAAVLGAGASASAPASPGLLAERSLTGIPSLWIVVGILVLVVAVRIIPLLRQTDGGRAAAQPAGSYGPAGAAVCSRCGLPFSRSLLGVNLVTGKLARCPHCGRWQVAGIAGRQALAAAEARLNAQTGAGRARAPETELGPEERLRRQIEDSKYERPQ